MEKKRVIILRSNPVNPDSRVEKEALALHRAGYDVRIIAWDRESNHGPRDDQIKVAQAMIPITRFGFKASYGEGFKNIIPYLKFQFSMKRWLKRHKLEYEIVHACDFDTAFFTYKFCIKKRKIFVFDIFDFLYGEPKSFLQRAVRKKQIDIINKSTATIICSEERKRQIIGSSPKKLIVLHNTPSSDQLPSDFSDCCVSEKYIKACYVGILQDGRLLREIGEYFSAHSESELHIGGFGYLSDYFNNLSKKCNNIHFYGRLSYKDTLELESKCNVLLALYNPAVENNRFAAPNKFYEALFLGKQIIMARGTGMSSVVEENSLGAVVDYSYSGFETGIETIKKTLFNCKAIKRKCFEIYQSKYSWNMMQKRLLEMYEEF